jgi:HAD superfamily hydrolase (TIGR01450 family)
MRKRSRTSSARRTTTDRLVLADLAGFVFDLDGCIWNGDTLNPGAGECLAALQRHGRRLGFITNNSRATGADVRQRLHRLGVTAAEHVLTPLEIIGQVITEQFGHSRVLVVGAAELADAVARGGHEIIDVKDYRSASVVAVGNDFDLNYERLTAASRVAAAGKPFVTPNVDPRLPIEGGDFLPGCGAIVAAVAAAAGVKPMVVGKPARPLFDIALRRMGVDAARAAMVGDSVPSDILGARNAGMRTVLYAPELVSDTGGADVVITSFHELARLARVV